MELSVVIVNYNVRYFLEQCLHSVFKAIEGIEAEVFVVDNNSVDGSMAMVAERFPRAITIKNPKNLGFSRANNQAIRASKGRYVLLLNPDTVVEEDTFHKCLAHMDAHPDAGALGVKMIDGKGQFLPESKRALPTPLVSFYKMFGLTRLFPRSKVFGRYHLGHLNKDQNHEVEVLAGAFMFIRHEALDRAGMLDEAFFMYGEDIDLSYRITKAGYKNLYFSETTIIHYKGESTKKGSLNYVRIFYQAMIIFANKHFSQRMARSYSLLINLAIYFRAGLSVMKRFARKLYRPLLDAGLIFGGYTLALPLWEQVRFDIAGYYPPFFLQAVVPGYILIWLLSIYYAGGYDRPLKTLSFLKGHLIGTLIILVIYALLPLDWRFSRALIFMGSAWGMLSMLGLRLLGHLAGSADYRIDLNKQKRLLIVGHAEESRRVHELLLDTQIKPDVVGYVSPDTEEKGSEFIGKAEQIDEIAKVNRIDEIVFCSKDLSARSIIRIMTRFNGNSPDFKIAPPESLSVIGSNSIDTAGELYTIPVNTIGKASNQRSKRLLDLVLGMALLLTFPLWILFVRGHFKSLGNVIRVILGKRSWVGYMNLDEGKLSELPPLRKGILHPGMGLRIDHQNPERVRKINMVYARDYSVINDLLIITRNFREI